jgi:hypothetical protein
MRESRKIRLYVAGATIATTMLTVYAFAAPVTDPP